jgi:lysophospholipase L1-like esterase
LWFSARGSEQEKAMYLYDARTVDAKTYKFAGVPFLNYTLNPNYEGVNDRGIRGPKVDVPKPKGNFRILALGGSTTYGDGLTAREAWPFRLQILLRDKYGYNVQVVNLGVPMYTSLHSIITLQTRGLALEPDLVIDYDGVNDAWVRIYEDPQCYSGDTPLFGFGTDRGIWQSTTRRELPASALYRLLAIRLGSMDNPINLKNRVARTGYCPPEGVDGSKFSDRREHNPPIYFERNLKTTAAIAQANNAKSLFLTFAWDTDAEHKALAADPTLDGARALLDAIDEQNVLVKQIARDTDSLFLDLAAAMAVNDTGFAWFQDDHVHHTPVGAERQAEIIAAYLDRMGVIPK